MIEQVTQEVQLGPNSLPSSLQLLRQSFQVSNRGHSKKYAARLLIRVFSLPGLAAGAPSRQAGSGCREGRLRPLSLLLGDGQEQLELGGKLFLGVEAVGEVNAADAAVRVDLHPQRLDIVRAVRAAREVAQVKLDLVPALIAVGRRCHHNSGALQEFANTVDKRGKVVTAGKAGGGGGGGG